jgi:excisionase family DNA binding protein
MARLTKTEATRQLGISRTTLYKLIDQGKVSATPDGLIAETELVRAATLRGHPERTFTHVHGHRGRGHGFKP